MTPKKKTNPIKTTLSVLWWTMTVLLVIILVTVLSAKFQGKVPKLFGYSVMQIVTGSMEPELAVEDYILIRNADPDDIKKGDIICFYSIDPAIYGMPNTHRVAEEPIITEHGIEFVTRGDANTVNDTYRVSEDKLIGRYVCTLDGLNGISKLFKGNATFIILIVLQVALIMIFLFSLFKRTDGEDAEKQPETVTKEEEERLKAEAISEYLASQKDNDEK